MNKPHILTLLCLLPIVALSRSSNAQKPNDPDLIWFSYSMAHHSTFRNLIAPIPDRKFRVVNQNEYCISIGSIGKSVYLSYLSLELNTFYLETDFFYGAINTKENRAYTKDEKTLVHESKRIAIQYFLVPSVAFERRFALIDDFKVGIGARLGYSFGRSRYQTKSTIGYGGNGIDKFDRLESNNLQPTRFYGGGKVSVLAIPEYQIKDWCIGVTLGLQYRSSTNMLLGESRLYRNNSSQRIRTFFLSQEEIGLLTGLRLSRNL